MVIQHNHNFIIHFIQRNHDSMGRTFVESKRGQPLRRDQKQLKWVNKNSLILLLVVKHHELMC